jgi:hypothetical protein
VSARAELLGRLFRNRPLAHAAIFKHRHPQPSPPFHVEMIQDWHGPAKGVLDLVFRGGAKSTIAEEAIVLMGGFREFRNCLVIGENYDRAAARLHAIKREIETNELLEQAFGPLRGSNWGEDRLILSTGAAIQALGKGQSLRGIKHEDMRPDLVFGDDLENREDCKTPAARAKTIDWFTLDVLPALDPSARVRVAATPLHPESLAMVLAKDATPDSAEAMRTGKWIMHKYPIYYFDERGEKVSSWPDRLPIEDILHREASYRTRGLMQGFRQEYLCESEAPETKAFRREHFVVEPQVKSWQAVYSFTDPARTVSRTAADTGRVVWSWIRQKLVVWDAVAAQWMPSEIVDDLFKVHEEHHPTFMGIEEDGLNQFLMQPIRQEQVKRGILLPVKAMKAPRGKLDFIRGLQPFFAAREVIFARELPALQDQLMGFPNGNIDVPNALAYALLMRPGAPIYDDFSARHVAEDIKPSASRPTWLVLNATHALLTAQLVQTYDGSVRVYADAVREGDPAQHLGDVIGEMQLLAGRKLALIAGPQHFATYGNVGLRQAAAKLPMEVTVSVAPERGRPALRGLLQRERQGLPMVMVSSEAKWTLNALAGGYSRVMLKQGQLADYAEDGVYRTLMEGLEGFVGLSQAGHSTDEDPHVDFNAIGRDGRPYRSIVGSR